VYQAHCVPGELDCQLQLARHVPPRIMYFQEAFAEIHEEREPRCKYADRVLTAQTLARRR